MDALGSAFGEEAPHGGAAEKVDRIMRNVAADFEELGEDDIENGEHHEWAKERPKITEHGTLISQFEISFSEFF